MHQLPSSPAARRNREPIADVLRTVLPEQGLVLELASGTGEHAAFFAAQFPKLRWQPSDPDREALAAIDAWREQAGLDNFEAVLRIDAEEQPWPIERADAILCINMVHISRWQATQGLMHGAARLLSTGAPLVLYGPYLRDGVPTAPSNVAFDHSLRARNPDWGLRDVAAVTAEAEKQGLAFACLVEMPANNLILVFRRL